MSRLYWSRAWADYTGADGAIVTETLQRATLLDDDATDRLRRAELAAYPTRCAVNRAMERMWPLAEHHALRGALACARQSARRAVAVHLADDEISSDRWSIWRATDRAVANVCAALVMRSVADPDDVAELARVWVDVMGSLPERYVPAEDRGPNACTSCGGTAGAPGVSAAEADRYARYLQAMDAHFAREATEEARSAREILARHTRDHYSRDQVRDLVDRELRGVTGISAKARAEIDRRFGITDEWRRVRQGGA